MILNHPVPWVHPGWYEPFDPKAWNEKRKSLSAKANRQGLEPRNCDECHTQYTPARPSQMTCMSEDCISSREDRLGREIRKLKQSLTQAGWQKGKK